MNINLIHLSLHLICHFCCCLHPFELSGHLHLIKGTLHAFVPDDHEVQVGKGQHTDVSAEHQVPYDVNVKFGIIEKVSVDGYSVLSCVVVSG